MATSRAAMSDRAERRERPLEHAVVARRAEAVVEVRGPQREQPAQVVGRHELVAHDPPLGGTVGDVVAQHRVGRGEQHVHLGEQPDGGLTRRHGEAALRQGDPVVARARLCRRRRGRQHRRATATAHRRGGIRRAQPHVAGFVAVYADDESDERGSTSRPWVERVAARRPAPARSDPHRRCGVLARFAGRAVAGQAPAASAACTFLVRPARTSVAARHGRRSPGRKARPSDRSATHFARARYGAGTMPSRSHSSANVSSSHLNEHDGHVRIVGEVRARHREHLAADLEDGVRRATGSARWRRAVRGRAGGIAPGSWPNATLPPCRDASRLPSCPPHSWPLDSSRCAASQPASPAGPLRFEVSYPASRSDVPLDGRLLLMLSTRKDGEPRFHIAPGPEGQPIFGLDVEGWPGGAPASVSDGTIGFPVQRLSEIPAGTYTVQALFHRYETFTRSDGHTVKMPMDRGEGQQWNLAPGNLYSTPRQITIDPVSSGAVVDHARPDHPADPGAGGHEVREARAHPERAAHEVLGPADVSSAPACSCPRAGTRIRSALPALRLPRPLPRHDDGLARDAARSEPGARLLRSLPPEGLQPHPAGVRAISSTRTGRDRASRAPSPSKSSTPIRTTTTRTP